MKCLKMLIRIINGAFQQNAPFYINNVIKNMMRYHLYQLKWYQELSFVYSNHLGGCQQRKWETQL